MQQDILQYIVPLTLAARSPCAPDVTMCALRQTQNILLAYDIPIHLPSIKTRKNMYRDMQDVCEGTQNMQMY